MTSVQGRLPVLVDVEDILDEIDAWELSSGNHVTVFVSGIIDRTDNAQWSINTRVIMTASMT